jgi:hypothetical protein
MHHSVQFLGSLPFFDFGFSEFRTAPHRSVPFRLTFYRPTALTSHFSHLYLHCTISTTMTSLESEEVVKRGIFGKKKTSTTSKDDEVVVKSPGMFGKKKTTMVIDGTPSTVVHDDRDDDGNSSVGSSVSGSGRKKKPRKEYQKQIDTLKDQKKTLVKENEQLMADFDIIKAWATSPPLPDSTSKVLSYDGVEQEAEAGAFGTATTEDEPKVVKTTRIFGKKPRAEYQAEIDVLIKSTEDLKVDNNRILSGIKAIKSWANTCPL